MATDAANQSNGIKNPTAMWSDPDVEARHGILLSDRIKYYASQVSLISPFLDSNLGPASYDITLGPDCWYADHAERTGQSKRTLAPNEALILEPNSIVYVSSTETLRLPFYMVGRFNLKLKLLHEGLLMGAGPQVDPGFEGKLSCPIHNVSGSRVSLICGHAFAVIEFEKTTKFAEKQQWLDNELITDIRKRGEELKLIGLDGNACHTFPAKSLNREPVRRYVPTGKLVTSSMQALASRQADLETQFSDHVKATDKSMSKMNWTTFLTVAVIAISFSTYFWASVSWQKSLHDNALQAIERVKTLTDEQHRLEMRIQELQQTLERKLANPHSSSSPDLKPARMPK